MTREEKRAAITADEVRRMLSYDPSDGSFAWNVRPSNCIHVGDIAGSPSSHGYIKICVMGVPCYAHRLAWLYVHGKWPAEFIDHIDRNKSNNAISNLREVTRVQNYQNTESLGYTRVKGTTARPYQSIYMMDGVRHYLGRFATKKEARNAYLAASAKYAGEYGQAHRLGFPIHEEVKA